MNEKKATSATMITLLGHVRIKTRRTCRHTAEKTTAAGRRAQSSKGSSRRRERQSKMNRSIAIPIPSPFGLANLGSEAAAPRGEKGPEDSRDCV